LFAHNPRKIKIESIAIDSLHNLAFPFLTTMMMNSAASRSILWSVLLGLMLVGYAQAADGGMYLGYIL
jgi:hypothetical protein